jgi:electron transport complex protein RnfC
MLYTLLGRRLRPGRLPTDQGVILLDAAAAIAVGRVALFGATAIAAPVVLRDHMLQQSFFTFAAPGIALGEVLQQTRTSAQSTLLRAGDVLRDVRCDLQSVIAVGTENVLHASQAEPINNPDPCTRCAWCIDACPTRVQPAGVFEAAQRGDLALAEASGVEACLECGVCSYVCPSGLPLLPAIQMMRRAVRGQ